MSALSLRRVTGAMFVVFTIAFLVAASVLSATFDWPDILRQPPDTVLSRFSDGGAGLVWTWAAVGWSYGLLLVPVLMLDAVLRPAADRWLPAAQLLGAAAVLASAVGFLRWVFFGGEGIIAENRRDEQRKIVKYNHLVANLVIFHNVVTMTKVLRQLIAEGHPVSACGARRVTASRRGSG